MVVLVVFLGGVLLSRLVLVSIISFGVLTELIVVLESRRAGINFNTAS